MCKEGKSRMFVMDKRGVYEGKESRMFCWMREGCMRERNRGCFVG